MTTIYKPEDLIKLLNISRSSVYKLLQSGALKSLRIGRLYRIPSAYLEEYLYLGYNKSGSCAGLPDERG